MTLAISFVVTCKGRLHQLQQSLPHLVAQPDSECIVVDYDCPDGTADWVSNQYPSVKIIRVSGAPRFNYSHAHNLGGQAAAAPWLCFVDADILVNHRFSGVILPLLHQNHYYRPNPMDWNAYGSFVCARSDFDRIGGYDEVIEGWGSKDDDVYRRLEILGRQPAGFPGELFVGLNHDDDSRTRYYEIKDRLLNQRLNSFYLHVKYDLERQMNVQSLTLAVRQGIYREIRKTFLDTHNADLHTTRFEVNLPDRPDAPIKQGWHIKRKWIYEMGPRAAPGPSQGSDFVRTVDAYFSANSVRKLHIGCGSHPLDGWLNTDIEPVTADILQLDATGPLPFADDSFDFVFTEHLIEHMPYVRGCAFLAECRRILKTGGGFLRIATPDLAFLIDLYRPDKSTLQKAFLDWSKERFLPWAPSAEDTFVINNAVRDWGHQFIYDEKVLRQALELAGFSEIERHPLMKSGNAELRNLENEKRKPAGLLAAESLVFEASKK